MPRLVHAPPLPRAIGTDSFFQCIELREGRTLLGRTQWYMPEGIEAVVQIVELTTRPQHRRHGHATTLLAELISQARSLCKVKHLSLRRIWVAVEHKTQVVARAFLTKHGFHHICTIRDLLAGQDLLIYSRAFD